MRGLLVVVVLLAWPVQAQVPSAAAVPTEEGVPSAERATRSGTGSAEVAAPTSPVEGAQPPGATPPRGDRTSQVGPDRVLGAVLWGGVGLAVTAAYAAGASFAGDSRAGGTLAIAGGVVSAGLAGAFIGLWVNWRKKEPTSMVDYLLAPIVGGLAGALLGGVLAGAAGTPPGTSRTVTHVVVTSLLFCETAGVVAVRLFD